MSQVVTASNANRRFSELLRRVRAEETVAITSHGQTVAYLVPKEAASAVERARRLNVLREIAVAANGRPLGNIGRWTRDELYD